MQRIAGANTVLIAPGKNGFQDQNTAAGIAGTQVTAAFMTAVQEELCAIIEGTGGALNPAVNSQVLSALIAALAPSPIYFTAPGSGVIVAPSWATRLHVRMWGAGAQGGAGGSGAGGGGGGAGAFTDALIGGIAPGASITWQVGNGGGLVGPSLLDTSLVDAAGVTLCACHGGTPGNAGAGSSVGVGGSGGGISGPSGGAYTIAQLGVPGAPGGNGNNNAGALTGGAGGAAFGGSYSILTPSAGFNGNSPGCGGGGGGSASSPGTGAHGAMILRWLP